MGCRTRGQRQQASYCVAWSDLAGADRRQGAILLSPTSSTPLLDIWGCKCNYLSSDFKGTVTTDAGVLVATGDDALA
jgi:hypothetical protein